MEEREEQFTGNEKPGDENKKGISRRGFLKTAGASIAGLLGLSACEPERGMVIPPTGGQEPPPLFGDQYPEVPGPDVGPPPGMMGFFTPEEARTVEALVATILPGTPEDPGAREAGVVYYIDATLWYDKGFAERTYYSPPFAVAYEGDEPPEDMTPDGLNVIWVPAEVHERYGWQSILTPREMYRMGVIMVNNYSNQQYGMKFSELDEAQQEEVVGNMADGEIDDFGDVAARDFFEVLRNHTIEGMFSDPLYRGNRDLVGWKLIGYPGAQRAYTPEDMHTENYHRNPQSLADLHPFNPGMVSHPNAILPVTGSGTPGPESEGTGQMDTPNRESPDR